MRGGWLAADTLGPTRGAPTHRWWQSCAAKVVLGVIQCFRASFVLRASLGCCSHMFTIVANLVGFINVQSKSAQAMMQRLSICRVSRTRFGARTHRPGGRDLPSVGDQAGQKTGTKLSRVPSPATTARQHRCASASRKNYRTCSTTLLHKRLCVEVHSIQPSSPQILFKIPRRSQIKLKETCSKLVGQASQQPDARPIYTMDNFVPTREGQKLINGYILEMCKICTGTCGRPIADQCGQVVDLRTQGYPAAPC